MWKLVEAEDGTLTSDDLLVLSVLLADAIGGPNGGLPDSPSASARFGRSCSPRSGRARLDAAGRKWRRPMARLPFDAHLGSPGERAGGCQPQGPLPQTAPVTR